MPDNDTARLLLTQAQDKAGAGDLDGAITDLTEAIRLDPDFADAYFQRGLLYVEMLDHDGVIADFSEVIHRDPQNALAYFYRGNAYNELDNYDDAIDDFDATLALNPNHTTAYHSRGLAHWGRRDLDAAIRDYSATIRLDPDSVAAYLNRGLALRKIGDLEGAVSDYTKGISYNPDRLDLAYYNRGVARHLMHDLEGAISDYSEALHINPQFTNARRERGLLYFEQNEFEKAQMDFKETGYSLSSLARLLLSTHSLGDSDYATRLWQTLIAMDQRFGDIEWVRKELDLNDSLVEEARKLIDLLQTHSQPSHERPMPKWPEHGYVESDDQNLYYWKARTLWQLAESLPVEQVPLDNFDWTNSNFQCNSLSDPPLWRDIGNHTKQILAADLQYPIIISDEGNVMDGMHRILKCYAFGLPTVKAVRFSENPPPDMIVPKDKSPDE